MKYIIYLTLTGLLFYSCNGQKSSRDADTDEKEKTSVSIEEVWATDTVLKVPESVLYDEERNVLYVANIVGDPRDKDDEGFISKLSPKGDILELKWIEGLNAPKGMGVYKNFLYVTDIDEIIVIDIEESKLVESFDVPEASFLNDLTIDDNGLVYFSDSDKDKIHVLRNGMIETWLEGDLLSGPNGLYWEEDMIMLASSGHEQFKEISLPSKEISIIAAEIGHGDGIAKDAKGNYVVSSWAGQVFYVHSDGQKTELLDTREQGINTADLDMIVDEDLVLIPTFFDNRVVAYRLVFE